ncbi:MAG: hypothetical protein JO257_22415, partial [Deltaproteobacteria bacterium]|nr:hypothetical protein [Deltaproteobacteria bacterium]
DAHTYEVYLVRDADNRRFDFILGIVFVLGAAVSWFFWIRRFVRDRRAKP